MLTKAQKKQIVEELASELKGARAVVFSDYQGLPNRDIQELRFTLRRESVKYKVIKLTLLKRALEMAGIDTAKFSFGQPLSVSYSKDDEVAPARTLQTFAKKHEHLKIIAGILDGRFIGGPEVKALAALPTKFELQGQLVYVIASPLRGLASVLSGNIRGLLTVLNAKIKYQNGK
ncbi:MAG: 50S ribosomal protein L10 [Candidatus Doudnabacteria bacterium]|nr:50S ribosomal protein L10 [Candidatus Doudnabacteria bacterium]